MKQTAVEWLACQYNLNKELFEIDIEQAKELEKEQQSYSSEEVLEIIKKLYIEIGFQFTMEIKEWVNKQFNK